MRFRTSAKEMGLYVGSSAQSGMVMMLIGMAFGVFAGFVVGAILWVITGLWQCVALMMLLGVLIAPLLPPTGGWQAWWDRRPRWTE